MKIQILTPENIIFDGEVKSVTVPGYEGEFQMLENHAAIVSALTEGKIKLQIISSTISKDLMEEENLKIYNIKGGILEFNNNKGIILCD